MAVIRHTISLYLYDEPVLETYWHDYIAAEKFCREIFKRRAVQRVVIWKGEAKEWTPEAWKDPNLLYWDEKK
jgi:hypothetical protein